MRLRGPRAQGLGFNLRAASVPSAATYALLGILILVAFTRAPYILVHGRFWAEEGAIHLRDAMTSASPGDLLFVYSRAGYFNLVANVGTWVATGVSLERAPLVTGWLSFGVVALCAWVALSWPSELLPNAGARLGAATLLVVGTLAEPEVWLNTLNLQTYLAILVVLLLFVRVDDLGRGRYVLSVGLLLVAGLSGLYSAVLAPLYVARALQERTVRRRASALAISGAALIQVLVVLTSRTSGALSETKLTLPGAGELFRTVSAWHVSGFLVGHDRAEELMRAARTGSPWAWLGLGALTLLLAAFLAGLLRDGRALRVPVLLVGAFVLTEVLVQLGSLGEAGGRYAVVPIAILTLMAVHGAATARHAWLRSGAVALCVLVFVAGVLQFWTFRPKLLRCIDCPRWDREVSEWRDTPGDPLEIWPYDVDPPWAVNLPGELR